MNNPTQTRPRQGAVRPSTIRDDGLVVLVATGLAVLVWALSFLGPLSATTVGAGCLLATLHLVVGAALVAGLRRTRVA